MFYSYSARFIFFYLTIGIKCCHTVNSVVIEYIFLHTLHKSQSINNENSTNFIINFVRNVNNANHTHQIEMCNRLTPNSKVTNIQRVKYMCDQLITVTKAGVASLVYSSLKYSLPEKRAKKIGWINNNPAMHCQILLKFASAGRRCCSNGLLIKAETKNVARREASSGSALLIAISASCFFKDYCHGQC